jgi:hypothetical protein
MKFLSFLLLFIVCSINCAVAQTPKAQIDHIAPYPKAVPGQIMEARVQGIGESPMSRVNPADCQIEIIQDANKFTVKARTARSTFVSEPKMGQNLPPAPRPPDFSKMKALQAISFVVPQGLHPGEAQVVVNYRNQRTDPVNLTILEKPERPAVSSSVIETISGAPSSPATVTDGSWRLERGAKTELYISPLVDPEDPQSAVLIRFIQGENSYDATTSIVHEDASVQQLNRGFRFSTDRDLLYVQIPAELQAGPVKVEIRLRANNVTGDPVTIPALITDATRSAELPTENAPRSLVVTPTRVGAGQAVLISVDHLRTLNPSPAETMVLFEQEDVRYSLKPEMNSAALNPNLPDDAPVLLMVRPSRQIIGKAQVRVFNSLRGEQGGISAPVALEIIDDVFAPELFGAAESTSAELAPLRQMYEMQKSAGRRFPEYDPANRYLSIRVKGIDLNPNFVKITLTQDEHSATLRFADFSNLSNDVLIVRLPEGFHKGTVELSIQNKGAERYSKAVTTSFELSH